MKTASARLFNVDQATFDRLARQHIRAVTAYARAISRDLGVTVARHWGARVGLVGLVVAGLSFVALPADAHVEATPPVVKPGVSTTITFTVPHGCLASPTVKLAVKLPTSIAKVMTVAPKGWTGSVSGSVATFTGGPLPVKQKAGFGLTFVAPKTEGTLQFPTVQTCEKGQIVWVQQPLANGGEPEYPVPTVLVSSKPTKAAKHR